MNVALVILAKGAASGGRNGHGKPLKRPIKQARNSMPLGQIEKGLPIDYFRQTSPNFLRAPIALEATALARSGGQEQVPAHRVEGSLGRTAHG